MKFENNFEKLNSFKYELLKGKLCDHPDFTICIPTYGRGKFLDEAINNLAMQNLYNLKVQFIICNNKKPIDNKFINKYMNLIPNLAYYFCQDNVGQYNNFNECCLLAKTEFFSMLHDDDLLIGNYFDYVRRVLNFSKKYKNIGMFHQKQLNFTKCITVNNEKKFSIYRKYNFETIINMDGGLAYPTAGIIFNKKALISVGGFDERYYPSADALPGLRLMECKFKVFQSRTINGYYRVEANASIEPEVTKEFIKKDFEIWNDWFKKTIIRRIYFKLFWKFFYSRNIDNKILLFGKFNDLKISDLDSLGKYKKYKKYGLYNLIYKFFLLINSFFKLFFIRSI